MNHGWIGDKGTYLSIIKSMDFAMQVTLSESFNYTAAEHMVLEVPVILSEVIPFAKDSKEIAPIVIKRPEDISEINKAVGLMVSSESFRKEMGEASKIVFEKYNEKSKNLLTDNLSEIIV